MKLKGTKGPIQAGVTLTYTSIPGGAEVETGVTLALEAALTVVAVAIPTRTLRAFVHVCNMSQHRHQSSPQSACGEEAPTSLNLASHCGTLRYTALRYVTLRQLTFARRAISGELESRLTLALERAESVATAAAVAQTAIRCALVDVCDDNQKQ